MWDLQESDFIRMDTARIRELWDEMHQKYPDGLINSHSNE